MDNSSQALTQGDRVTVQVQLPQPDAEQYKGLVHGVFSKFNDIEVLLHHVRCDLLGVPYDYSFLAGRCPSAEKSEKEDDKSSQH